MQLVIAEKPSVAQALAKVLGATNRKDGYVEGNGYFVSWCVGHLVELAAADAYDPRYSKWVREDLPIVPEPWQFRISAATKKQFGVLKALMHRVDVESLVCALAQTLSDRLDYDQKPEKTNSGELVSTYMCSPESAAEEFLIGKQIYEATTGRSQPTHRDIIMYRVIQSFKPGEIDPETANRIGYELAMRFTKGKHQFVVSTHTDRQHVHTHIEFNSTNLDCDGKFNNFKDSALVLREMSDALCRENGLSVIESPKTKGQRYEEKAAAKRGRSFKETLRLAIDNALVDCTGFDELLARLRSAGY